MNQSKVAKYLATLCLALLANPAWAVWNESIAIADAPNPPDAGASVVFEMPDGQEVPGTVEERDNKLFFVFALPGDGPSAGTIRFDNQTFRVPLRPRSEALIVDLTTGKIRRSAQKVIEAQTSRYDISVEAALSYFEADDLSRAIRRSRAELGPAVFVPIGITDFTTAASADDDDSNTGVIVRLDRIGGAVGQYLSLGYNKFDGFSGFVSGDASLPGFALNATSIAESEYEVFVFIAGLTYSVGKIRLSGGVGITQVDFEDAFTTSNSVNGMVVNSFSGGTSRKEHGTTAEAGLEFLISRHWSVGIRAKHTWHALDGHTVADVGVRFSF